MENPFELILERLDRIEKTIEQLSANGPLANINDPMDVKDLSAYLKISASTIYKFTSTRSIPYYKNGKRLFFKREEINDWIFTTKINSSYEIEKEANEYIRKHPRKY
jgi:excisionase family DNA binding protein